MKHLRPSVTISAQLESDWLNRRKLFRMKGTDEHEIHINIFFAHISLGSQAIKQK